MLLDTALDFIQYTLSKGYTCQRWNIYCGVRVCAGDMHILILCEVCNTVPSANCNAF